MTRGIILAKQATHVHLLLNTRNCLGKKQLLRLAIVILASPPD